jgi:hypothetical protein
MKNTKISVAIPLLLLACSPLVKADSIIVPNYSFELSGGAQAGDNTSGTGVDDWTFSDVGDPSGTLRNGQDGPTTDFANQGNAQGAVFAFLNLSGSQTGTITSASSLGNILANTTYTLTVAVGNNAQADDMNNGSPGNVFLSLLGNGTAVNTTFIADGTVPDSSFEDESVSFTTGASGGVIGEALTIQLAAENSGDGVADAADLDNVRLTDVTTAPEPSTWALFAAGFAGLVWIGRRKLTV